MLRIAMKPQPEWLDLGQGLRVLVRPLSSTIMGAAREDARMDGMSEETAPSALSLALAKAIAERAILEWEGALDDETGEPLPVSPEAIDAVMEMFPIFEAWQIKYVAGGLLLDQEKNASGPSLHGTSAGDKDTARPARRAAKSARQS